MGRTLEELQVDYDKAVAGEKKQGVQEVSIMDIANKSFQCNRKNHVDCKWGECQCYCHDIWKDYEMCGGMM